MIISSAAQPHLAGSSCTGPTVNGTRLSFWCDLQSVSPLSNFVDVTCNCCWKQQKLMLMHAL